MGIDQNSINDVVGEDVYGSDGDRIGQVGQVYLDDVTGTPEWVTVKTGLFGTKESFVPVSQAELSVDGLRVPYDTDRVKHAPSVDADGHLSHEEEAELYRHYGMDDSEHGTIDTEHAEGTERDLGHDQQRVDLAAGRRTDEVGDEQAMTRSEERLNVGTTTQESGRARLRKYVVTEEQTVTVPVTREEVRIEREPITEANRDQALAGAEISEEEHEVVLHEERVVVNKETVPVERVALGKETVTEQQEVTESVRKEQIDTDGVEHSDHINRR